MRQQVFSFRAECSQDIEVFQALLSGHGVAFKVSTYPDANGLPDVAVEIKADAPLVRLRELLRQVVDGHVMLQTLRQLPLAQNTLERDFDLI